MYSKISNSIRESILELRIYSDSPKHIMSICFKTVSLYRGYEERAQILPQPGGALQRNEAGEVRTIASFQHHLRVLRVAAGKEANSSVTLVKSV